jgi:hypothetical protein
MGAPSIGQYFNQRCDGDYSDVPVICRMLGFQKFIKRPAGYRFSDRL